MFWFRIDGAPPLRSVPEPFGSQVGVAGVDIVVSELSPARWADDEVPRRIFEPIISTDWAEVHVFRPHLQLDRKYSNGVCRSPGNFLTIMNVAILPSLVSTPNSHVLG
jgi:hypothetical protein